MKLETVYLICFGVAIGLFIGIIATERGTNIKWEKRIKEGRVSLVTNVVTNVSVKVEN